MIGRLTGIIEKQSASVLCLVGGVGYEVFLGAQNLAKLENGQERTLEIYTLVKEDVLQLFGFLSTQEKQLFIALLGVSGIGPRTALAITNQGINEVIVAVQQADLAFFTAIPRLGKKNAQKIIIELAPKLGSSFDLELSTRIEQSEVGQALRSLGFIDTDIVKALSQIDDQTLSTSQQITQALKILGTRRK
jgi:Holliday junction DNA helicase RuvA